jgi:hypothetical protein
MESVLQLVCECSCTRFQSVFAHVLDDNLSVCGSPSASPESLLYLVCSNCGREVHFKDVVFADSVTKKWYVSGVPSKGNCVRVLEPPALIRTKVR